MDTATMTPPHRGRTQGYDLAHLRDWRLARHLEAQQLAAASGISTSTLSRLENRKQRASLGTVALLAEALRITRAQLLDESPFRDLDTPQTGAEPQA